MTLPIPFFSGATLDDVMLGAVRAVLEHGAPVHATQGEMRELTGIMLQLRNPRARLSRTATRGRPFSALGEFCWYLAGSDALDVITQYLPKYPPPRDGTRVVGDAYGPRLFPGGAEGQVHRIVEMLTRKRSSRQAVIQLFDADDLVGGDREVPCTCTLQFLIREERLSVITYMRSNDAYIGLPHDVFSFTMLQELVASALRVELGMYTHMVGSFHVYTRDLPGAQQFLTEGYQSTQFAMPLMPPGDPWKSVAGVRRIEAELRSGQPLDAIDVEDLAPYWVDLMRLLDVYFAFRCKDAARIDSDRARMDSRIYDVYIEQQLRAVQERTP